MFYSVLLMGGGGHAVNTFVMALGVSVMVVVGQLNGDRCTVEPC